MEYIDLIIDLHKGNPRQGPGREVDAQRAFAMTGLDPEQDLQMADLGCGTGKQSIWLARHTKGHISAVDLFPAFLEVLKNEMDSQGLNDRITCVEASMDALPFGKESLDLIWSEGAIYNIGFEKGIRYLYPFLKNGGSIAISEITWISDDRPKELQDFWDEAYPEMGRASEKITLLEKNGYTLQGYFYLDRLLSTTARSFRRISGKKRSF